LDFFAQNGGYEYNLMLAIAALTLAFTGPGSLSVDAPRGYRFSGTLWGVVASAAGVFAGMVSLLERKATPHRSDRHD
jgi:putative oxidoreductase